MDIDWRTVLRGTAYLAPMKLGRPVEAEVRASKEAIPLRLDGTPSPNHYLTGPSLLTQELLRFGPVVGIGRRRNARSKKSEPAGHHTGWIDTWRPCGDRSYWCFVYVGFVAR